MTRHALIKRTNKSPLGTRIRVRCQTCRDQMPGHGEPGEATDWVQVHVGVPRDVAVGMVRDAGRWVA